MASANPATTDINLRLCKLRKWPDSPGLGFGLADSKKPPHMIGSIESNSPAAVTGLRFNDVIVEVNGKSVTDMERSKVQKLIAEAVTKKNGVDLLVVDQKFYEKAKKEKLLKASKAKTTETPSPMPADIASFPKNKPRTCNIVLQAGENTFGFDLAAGPGEVGAFVQDVIVGSAASRANLRRCDRLIEVNDQFVDNLAYEELKKLIGQARGAGRLKLYVMDTATYKHYMNNGIPLQSQGNPVDGDDGDMSGGEDGDYQIGAGSPDSRIEQSSDDEGGERIPSTSVPLRAGVAGGLSMLPVGPRTDIRQVSLTLPNQITTYGFSLNYPPNTYPTVVVTRDSNGQLINPTAAGLEDGYSLIEINGENIRNLPKQDIVNRIKNHPRDQPLVLLIADEATVQHYDRIQQPIHARLPNIRRFPDRDETTSTRTNSVSRIKGSGQPPGIAGLVQNPLVGTGRSTGGIYENEVTPTRPGPGLQATKTTVISIPPGPGGMGFTLNSAEPDGTPHRFTTVADGSPAANAGLKVNDVLVSINDTPVEGRTRNDALQIMRDAVGQAKSSNRPLNLTVLDTAPTRTLTMSSATNAPRQTSVRSPSGLSNGTGGPGQPNQRTYILRSSPDFQGLGIVLNLTEPEGTPYRITQVKPSSPAERANLRVGDTIISINGKNIENLGRAEVSALLRSAVDQEKTRGVPVKLIVLDTTELPGTTVQSESSSRTSTPDRSYHKQPNLRPATPVVPTGNQRMVPLISDPKSRAIGLDIDTNVSAGERPRVTRVAPLSAAASAGLQVGDVIVAINGQDTRHMNGAQVRQLLRDAVNKQLDEGTPLQIIVEPESDLRYSITPSVPDEPAPQVSGSATAPPRQRPETKPASALPNGVIGSPTPWSTSVLSDRSSDRKYDQPTTEDTYRRPQESILSSLVQKRPDNRTKTQIDLISGSSMYRYYRLKGEPGQSFGFRVQTNGGKHWVQRIEGGSIADKAGLMENDQIVEINHENVLGKTEHVVRNLLRTAEMDGSLRLTVYPQSLRPLNKRSERTLSTMNLGNTKTNTTLSSSMGDLPLSTLRSRHEWNFEEEVVLQQLPDPLVEPTNPLPRACLLVKSPPFRGCGFRLMEKESVDTPIVAEVSPNSPAKRSGIAIGDHIVYIGDRSVQAFNSFDEKVRSIQQMFETGQVKLVVLTSAAYRVLQRRGGVLKQPTFDYQEPRGNELRPRLCELLLLDQEDSFGFICYRSSPTYVKEVQAGTAAEESGVKKNDKILEVNGQNTSLLTPRQFEEMIRASLRGRKLTLLVIDIEGYQYSIDHAIPLNSELPLVRRGTQHRMDHDQSLSKSVCL